MATILKEWSIILSICIALGIGTTTGMKTQTFTHHFGREAFLQDTSFLTSPGQVFGNCDQRTVKVTQNKFQVDCTLAMETIEAIESPNHLRYCNFSLNADVANNEEMYLIDDIIAITTDTAILKIQGLESNMFYILNFTDCTASNSHTNPNPISFYAPSDNTFDVIFHRTGYPEDNYRTVLDTKGNTTKETELWLKIYSDIIAIAHSPTKGRIVVDQYIKKLKNIPGEPFARIYAVANDGSIKRWGEYQIERANPQVRYKRTVVSTTYNLVSACTKLNTTITCAQFDQDGVQKFETKMLNNEFARIHSFNLCNLPGGGFLLFINKCNRTEKNHCLFSDTSFDVNKYGVQGQFIGKLNVDNNSKTTYSKTTHIFESKDNEICLSAVQERTSSDNLALDIICLKDEDFAGEITWPNH